MILGFYYISEQVKVPAIVHNIRDNGNADVIVLNPIVHEVKFLRNVPPVSDENKYGVWDDNAYPSYFDDSILKDADNSNENNEK